MRRSAWLGIIIGVLSLLALLTTVNFSPQERVMVPFSSPSGYAGQILLELPSQVYAGDRKVIKLQVNLEELPVQADSSLIVHLEGGFEEISPTGEMTVLIKQAEKINVEWHIRTAFNTMYPGTVWIWTEGSGGKHLIMAKDFDLESRFFVGTRVYYIRLASILTGLFACAWIFIANFFGRVKQAEQSQIN